MVVDGGALSVRRSARPPSRRQRPKREEKTCLFPLLLLLLRRTAVKIPALNAAQIAFSCPLPSSLVPFLPLVRRPDRKGGTQACMKWDWGLFGERGGKGGEREQTSVNDALRDGGERGFFLSTFSRAHRMGGFLPSFLPPYLDSC